MAVTTWIYPNIVTTEAIDGGTVWVNPNNVKVSDDTYTTCDGSLSNWLICCEYVGLSALPATAKIVGLEFAVEGGSVGDTGITDNDVYVCYNGERIGTNRAHNVEWPSIEDAWVHGGSFDVWGLNLTPLMMQNATFGVHMSVKSDDGNTVSIDSIAIKVYYLETSDTDVQICNEALCKIGEPQITSMSGTDARSKVCNLNYSSMRQHLLTAHIWQFATVQVQLESATTPPLFGWSYSYQLPSNFLKVNDAWPKTTKYEIGAGNVIHTNGDGKISYIADIINPVFFTFDFREALLYKMTLALHTALVDKTTGYQVLLSEAKAAIRGALHRGTIRQKPAKNTFDWCSELTE